MYYYTSGSSKPVGVKLKDEYKLEIRKNVPGYLYFIADIRTNDIDLLKELDTLLQDFVDKKVNKDADI